MCVCLERERESCVVVIDDFLFCGVLWFMS